MKKVITLLLLCCLCFSACGTTIHTPNAWQEASIKFEGSGITFPCKYLEVTDRFTIENIDKFEPLEPYRYERDFSYLTTKSGLENLCETLRVELYNPSDKTVSAKNGYIYYFSVYADEVDATPLPNVVFPNGVTFDTTYGQIKHQYGEPTEIVRNRVSYYNTKLKLSITFDCEDDVIHDDAMPKWFEYEIMVEKYDWEK